MADEPRRRSRSRSRSPSRRKAPPKGSGGFRWKDQRSSGRDSREDRENRYNRDRDRDRNDSRRTDNYRDRSPQRDRGYGREEPRRDRVPKGPEADRNRREDKSGKDETGKKEKPAKKAAPVKSGQEMIIVHINDRLGTKTAVPCLPSDTIGQLKLMIAARIGREASQIMLRRQGERPFKDQLSLYDYGVSNGVQLDLELDTGD